MDTETFTLLLVDDSEMNRETLGQLLQVQGYNVLLAANGARALEIVRQGGIDLVLLDVLMPGIHGLEVLRQLRRDHTLTDLPVIMVTANDQSEDVVHALALGANDYLTKPLDFPVVLARVKTQVTLKRSVQEILELKQHLGQKNTELEAANAKLRGAYARMKHDVEAAARVQGALLPAPTMRFPGVNFAWAFEPCEELAGDFLGIVPLDDHHVGLYVLDVSGHGVASALLSVTLSHFLSRQAGGSSLLIDSPEGAPARLVPPAEVAERLSQRFPLDETTGQFFTIFYGILDAHTGEFVYVSAGHPGAIHVPCGQSPQMLAGSGFLIGLGDGYEQHTVYLAPGDRLYLYTDGVTETMSPPEKELFGTGRLLDHLARGQSLSLPASVTTLLHDLRAWRGGVRSRDDVTLLAVERQGRRPDGTR